MRKTLFSILRIAFGIVWAIDAYLKWQPTFLNGLLGMLRGASTGQSPIVQSWILFWIHIVSINPYLFAILIACVETVLALFLIFDLLPRTTYIVGIIFSLIVWSVAEGFGGPYVAGSTDIGAAIIYAFVFAAFWIGRIP